jgi:hypothetical protein
MGAVLEYAKGATECDTEGWDRRVWEGMVGADAVLEDYRKTEEEKRREKG